MAKIIWGIVASEFDITLIMQVTGRLTVTASSISSCSEEKCGVSYLNNLLENMNFRYIPIIFKQFLVIVRSPVIYFKISCTAWE